MASSSQGLRTAIKVILGIVILGLAYWLYRSITDPWEAVEREDALTEATRMRMSNVRAALIRYDERTGRFPYTLDTLHAWVRSDSVMQAHRDSLFGPNVDLDSFLFSPRPGGKAFEYVVRDTERVMVYELRDPDSDDVIGTLEPDPTKLNAASWE